MKTIRHHSAFLLLLLLPLGTATSALAQVQKDQGPSSALNTSRASTDHPDAHDEVESLDENMVSSGNQTAPWRVGVAAEEAALARDLFQEGNALVRESVFVPAIDKYEEALKHWNHPGIHYNLSLALLNLEQPLRLRQHLVEALRYQGQPLGEEKALRAQQYLNLVEKQLSHLLVTCSHPGALVKLDEKVVIRAPGKLDQFLPPGRHQLSAVAGGYVANEQDLSLVPGETKAVDLKLYTEQEWTKYKRHWSPLGPMLVTVGGVVVAGTGGLLFWLGAEKVQAEDDRIAEECPGRSGCEGDETTHSQAGETMQIVGIATMATGGAATLLGGVLMYVNRKIPYREDPSSRQLSFFPVVGSNFTGVFGKGTF